MRPILAALLLCAHLLGQINLIVDDDCATDYCPVVAPFKLWDRNEVNILAFIADSDNDYAAPVFRSHSIFYKRPTVPIYANQQHTPSNSICTSNNCNTNSWASTLVGIFDPGDTRANYTDCATGYRTLLAGAANASVTIAATGFATCLYQLLLSAPDGISALTGAQLVQQKVVLLAVCCGVNPTGVEWNFSNDYPSWSYLFANWTTQNGYPPIWLYSFGDASGTNFGPPTYALNTVNTELKQFQLMGFTQRAIWDEATVLFAARGLSYGGTTYWSDGGDGTMIVNSATNTPLNGHQAGYNSWSTGTASGHHYLVNVADTTTFNQIFDGYAYGFGFAALPPLAGPGSMGNGGITVGSGASLR